MSDFGNFDGFENFENFENFDKNSGSGGSGGINKDFLSKYLSEIDQSEAIKIIKETMKINIGNSYSDCLLIYLLFFNIKITLANLFHGDKDKDEKIEKYVEKVLSSWRESIEGQVAKKMRESEQEIDTAYAGLGQENVEKYKSEVYEIIDGIIESVMQYGRDQLLVKNTGQTYEAYLKLKEEEEK